MLREFTLLVDGLLVDALSDALLEAGALAVTVDDADAGAAEEQPLYGEPDLPPAHPAWPRSRLVVLLGAGVDPQQLLADAADAAAAPLPEIAAQRDLADADWVRLTQAQFPPTKVSDGLWIVPSWHKPPDPAAINIRLDPGAAFGTGTHPTTRLCLQWLAENRPRGRVLDYGCGSGILAIAAARLGAAEVIGTDIDEQALQAARANSAANAVVARYTSPQQLPADAFDVVLANILANPLKLLAPALLARMAPGGALVLSGILQRQADELIAAYRDIDPAVALAVWAEQDGWVCLAGRRS